MVEQIIHITNPSDVECIRFAEGLSSLDPAMVPPVRSARPLADVVRVSS